MYYNKFQRFCMACYYGWGHAGILAKEYKHSRLWYYFDILHYFNKYGLGSQRYIKYKFAEKSREQKDYEAGVFYQQIFAGRKMALKLRKFIAKWSDIKYITSSRRIERRNDAYRKFFSMGEKSEVEYGVAIYNYHYKLGNLKIGKNVIITRNCDIDITGDLLLEDNVIISEGAKILTHRHEYGVKYIDECNDILEMDVTHGCIQTPLHIGYKAWIGAHTIILPGVKEIGRFAVVGAGAVVEKKVPPYAFVKGNPAKIVGFKYSPEEIVAYEEKIFPPEQRIPYETLKANYEKYFNRERRKELREWMKF